MKSYQPVLLGVILVPILIFTACDQADEEDVAVGELVGSWLLTGLTVDNFRDAAAPAGTSLDTVAILTASWDLAGDVLGDPNAADQTLKVFMDGDVILDSAIVFDQAALAATGIQLTLSFTEELTYNLSGRYPTLRTDTSTCITTLETPMISDDGTYTADYLTGILGITAAFVLPPFDDGIFMVSADGNTLTLSFLDRDAHDERIVEIGLTWDEETNREIQGVPVAPVDPIGGFFSTSGELGSSAYLFDPVKLASWGGYLTFYALTINGTIITLILTPDNGITTEAEALVAIIALATAGEIHPGGIPYVTLLTDDSAGVFDLANPAAGGKLTYMINPVCVTINELIGFEGTLTKVQ